MQFSLRHKLLPIEVITLAYTLFTSLLILLFWGEIKDPAGLLLARGQHVGNMALAFLLYAYRPNAFTRFLRFLIPLALLGFWYPDTYEFCQLYPNLDHLFARADAVLFGCQPAITFSLWLPEKLWSELFHLGYFAYYPLIAATVLAPLLESRERFERTAFIVLLCFLFYYVVYLFLPVAGPQYYFHAVGQGLIEQGHFPHLGDYFRYHTEMAPSPGPQGFFHDLVEATQASGERPTAAFPSSHVGMSTVLLFLLWANNRRLFYVSLPFYFFLCCATVYIQAHYLVDVFGGWISAVLFYALAVWTWNHWPGREPLKA